LDRRISLNWWKILHVVLFLLLLLLLLFEAPICSPLIGTSLMGPGRGGP
jgi:hypothetical protein